MPQGLKPRNNLDVYVAAEAAPFQNKVNRKILRCAQDDKSKNKNKVKPGSRGARTPTLSREAAKGWGTRFYLGLRCEVTGKSRGSLMAARNCF
jgi:hypothetical protein